MERGTEAYERACVILEDLVRDRPGSEAPRRELATRMESLGTLLSRTTGHEQEGLSTLRQALTLRESIAQEHPDSTDDQVAVAAARRQIGNVCLLLGRNAEASGYLDRAFATLVDCKPEPRTPRAPIGGGQYS